MSDMAFYIDLIKYVGFPALIFIIWYIYHKSESQKWQEFFKQQEVHSERQFHLFRETVKNTSEVQKRESERQFSLLKDLTETVQYHAAVLARMESKIDNNQWCPIVNKEKRG